ncbi:MAG: ABC transporter permease subunit [Candidatus Sumerlaeota bacterium]|nr:ABC transporter permease subunit [Candidatus Sumerlaeota bacterium]
MRKIYLIFRTVQLEAIRRKEIYAIVLLSVLGIAAIGSIRFFNLPHLIKFYRETALQIMGLASALTVIVLGARQLPREFERRTIYTLLAKPVHRAQFLIGKFLGVLGSGIFCYGLFMIVFLAGCLYLNAGAHWGLFAQHIYLQIWMLAIIASLSFMLSLLGHLDMAVTVATLIYVMAQLFTSAITYIYHYVGPAGKFGLKILNYTIPQLSLLDLSSKAVHGETWSPLPAGVMLALTAYAAAYVAVFLTISYILFRKRPL